MRKVLKSSLSILLTFLIIVSALPISGFATGENELNSSITDISTESVNALGEVLSEPLNSSGEEVGYSIGKIDFADMVATVTLYAPDNSTVLVCLYDETDNGLVTSGKAKVNSSTEEVAIELAECELPEYFVIKGYIVDENNKPVSNVYENIEFTQRMEEFHAKTVDDFDPAYVINLDAAIDNNFAVVDGAAEAFEASSTENTVVTDDYENGEYVISNVSDELKAVAKGDIVFIKTGEGAEDFILTKVGTVSVSGSTVTINAAESAEPDELFQFVKFDTSEIGSVNTLSDTSDTTVTKDGVKIDFSHNFTLSNKNKPNHNVVVTKTCLDYKVTARLYGTLTIDFKYYRDKSADVNYKEFSKTFDIGVTGNIVISGTLGVTFQGDVQSPMVYGFQIFAAISVGFEFTGKVSADMTVSYKGSEGYIQETGRGINRKTVTSTEPKLNIRLSENVDVQVSVKFTAKTGFSLVKVIKAYLEGSVELRTKNTLFELEISNSNIGSSFPFLPWSETIPPEATEHPCKACIKTSVDVVFKAGIVLEASLNVRDYFGGFNKDGKFNFGLRSEPLMLSKTVALGDFRASYCNNKFEFNKIGDDSVCPHQTFLMAFLVVAPDENNAPVPNTIIEIKTDETTLNSKKSEFYNPYAPESVRLTTDSNGLAKTYLPYGIYSYEFKSNWYAILPGSKGKDEFIVKDKPKEFNLEAGKAQNVTVNVTDTEGNPLNGIKVLCDEATAKTNADGQATLQVLCGKRVFSAVTDDGKSADVTVNVTEETNSVDIQLYNGTSVTVNVVSTGGSPVKNANVNGLLTDAEGKVCLKLDKGTHTITASYNDTTAKKEITFDEEPIETTITLDLGYKVTCIVKNKEGTLVRGVDVQGVKTDKNGEAVLWMQNGEYTITVNASSGSATESFVVENSDVTIEFVLESFMEWSVTNGHLVISGCGPMKGNGPWRDKYSDSIEKVTINEGITSISYEAFMYCENIVSIEIPGSLKDSADFAFWGCYNLSEIYITDVAAWCGIDWTGTASFPTFERTTGELYINGELAKDVIIPDNVCEIKSKAFYGFKNIDSVIIPDTVTYIGDYAFKYCFSLTSITIPDSVTNIASNAFDNTEYSGDESNWENDVLYIDNHFIKAITSLSGAYEIKEGTKTIANGAFNGCIGLTSVTIPDSVTSIGDAAFSNCTSLEKVYWNAKNCTTVSSLGYPVIFGSSVEVFPTNVYNIAFDSSYTSIPEGAFKHSSVENVYIHSGITEIGKAAFYKCSNIQNIYYEGTPEQWAQVDIGHSNTVLDNKVSYNATMPGEIIENEVQASFFGYVKSVLSSFKPSSVDFTIEDGNISIENAENGTTYMVYIVKSESAEDFLSSDNLLYVSQQTATGEALKIPYNLRESYEDFAVVITEAVVTVPDCDANGHVFTTEKTNYLPTCTEEGSEIEVCRLCGYTEYIATEPTGHRYVTIPGCAATCTESGYTDSVICEICNEIVTEPTVISAGHTYGDWVIVTEATETTNGERRHTCTACGYEESQVVRATPILEEDVSENIKIYKGDISYAVFIAPESATYSFASNSNSYDAKGYLYDSEKQLLASNDDGLVDVNFEVVYTLEKGETYYIGVEADNSYDASISISVSKACLHENVADYDAVEVTCTTDGYTAGKLCNSCGKWIKGHRKISATGHSYGDWVVETEATCTTNGLKSRECISCRYKDTATIYATGHSGEWIVDIESTCSVQGLKHMVCIKCDEKTENMLPFAKHSYADGFCSVCGIEQLPESAHPYSTYCDETETIYKEGAISIAIAFSSDTYTESGWDYIYIYDANDNQVGRYSGGQLAGQTVVVNGDTVKIRLTSDSSNEYYGYCVTNIVVNYVKACSHETTKWITDQEATVYKAGSKHKECTECGETLKTATIKQLKCAKPVLKKVYNANSYVKVTWGTVKGADLYRVYRKTGTGSYEYIGSTKNTYFNDKEAGAGKICRYRIRAKNEAGYSEYSVSIAIKHIDEPTLKSIENSEYGVLIKWDKVTGAQKYNVYRKVSGGTYEYIGATTKTYYTDKIAESGKKYYYAIRAKRDDSISSQSASLSKYYLEDPTLNTPTSTSKGVGLRWSKVTGAEGYMVYRRTTDGSYTRIKTEKGVSNVTYRDTTAKKGTKYYYKVKAYYSKTYSAFSNTKSITDKY